MVEMDGIKILFDPFITANELACDINIADINPDFILLSHGHQDHILDVEAIAKQSDSTVVGNFEVANYFSAQGVGNVIPMNHGGTVDCNGVKVKMVSAVHTSSFPDGSYAGEAGGFVVAGSSVSFYYSGDTALHYDMKLIAEDCDVDFAFLCLGDHFTMGVADAVKAAQFVDTKKVIGMHFDTFSPISIDHEKAVQSFADKGIDLKIPEISEEFGY